MTRVDSIYRPVGCAHDKTNTYDFESERACRIRAHRRNKRLDILFFCVWLWFCQLALRYSTVLLYCSQSILLTIESLQSSDFFVVVALKRLQPLEKRCIEASNEAMRFRFWFGPQHRHSTAQHSHSTAAQGHFPKLK